MSGVGKKEQILEAATKLILKKGYSHTSGNIPQLCVPLPATASSTNSHD